MNPQVWDVNFITERHLKRNHFNALVIVAAKKRNELRKNSNILLTSMAGANLMMGVINMALRATVDVLVFRRIQYICLLDVLCWFLLPISFDCDFLGEVPVDIRMDGLQSYSDKKSPHELCDNPLAVLVTECAKARFPGQNFLEIQAPYAKKIEKRYDNYYFRSGFCIFPTRTNERGYNFWKFWTETILVIWQSLGWERGFYTTWEHRSRKTAVFRLTPTNLN